MVGAIPPALGAQVVQGHLLDDATGQPVVAATIHLLPAEERDEPVATEVTDAQGRFVLRAPRPASYRLRVSRIGYESITTGLVDLLGGDAPLEVEVRISQVAVVLAPLTIVSERAPLVANLRLENAGYYDRKARYGREGLGLGEFLDQEDIRQTNPSQVSDALRMVRGVWVQATGGRTQRITFRAHGCLGCTDGRCVPQVFINGAPAATGETIDELLSPWSLAAVEVYPGLSVPAEFWRDARSGMGACGAIVLWTGYGGQDEPAREQPMLPAPDSSARAFALDLLLATDTATIGDTLWTTVTLRNLSNDLTSVCVIEAYYIVRGSRDNRTMVSEGDDRSCLHQADLAPGGTRSWREPVTFPAGRDQSGDVLIQKHVRVRYRPCPDGDECEVWLRSIPHRLTLHRAR